MDIKAREAYVQNSPFTLIQCMTRICALSGRKLILAKTVCAMCRRVIHCLYTCSSYYRRCIRTSLSSLQSHVLTSLWSNSYTIREDGWNGARFQTTSTSLVRNNQLPICFRAVLLSMIRSLTMWEGYESGRCTFILMTSCVRVWIATSMHENIGNFLFVIIDVYFSWNL